nr:reverse transcriptase domain-containing protein [Tanacetum cinerariifolium]
MCDMTVILLPPLPNRPPIPPPRGAAGDRPAHCVVILGGIIYMKENIGNIRDNQKVKYIAGSFVGKALTWWNSHIHTRSREAAVGMSWENFKNLSREEFFLVNELQKLEIKFWNHIMVRVGHAAHTDRFHELA